MTRQLDLIKPSQLIFWYLLQLSLRDEDSLSQRQIMRRENVAGFKLWVCFRFAERVCLAMDTLSCVMLHCLSARSRATCTASYMLLQ